MRFRPSIILTITLLILSVGFFYETEAKTIEAGHATVSWKGKGVIEDLGDGGRVFSGTLTGTILVKHLPEGSAPAQQAGSSVGGLDSKSSAFRLMTSDT